MQPQLRHPSNGLRKLQRRGSCTSFSDGVRVAQCRAQSVLQSQPVTTSACSTSRRLWRARDVVPHAAKAAYPPPEVVQQLHTQAPTDVLYDAVIIGSGVGGLTAAAQLAAKGAKVVVLEKYLIPGGSASHYKRDGYTFDVGSSMMFGFGDRGQTNLITRALAAVDKHIPTFPDPVTVAYHLPPTARDPQGLEIKVWRGYKEFSAELTAKFPHEAEGIKGFYGECWNVFNALNVLELKSLEEIRYLMGEFVKQPLACLTLAGYAVQNTGDVARKHIKDPQLLQFIDLECFLWSTVSADLTPMISAGMVLCDRHYGGINYPQGGVGVIPEALVHGIEERGSHVVYKANVKEIVTQQAPDGSVQATGVRLADGRVFKGKTVISNATRWDTFEHMMGEDKLPQDEQLFRKRYKKAPSFFQLHMGVKASALAADTDCHHIILEDWKIMEDPHGLLFVSIPSLLDKSLAPEGHHTVHAFTPDYIDAWQDLPREQYEAKKEAMANALIKRLDAVLPGLADNITLKEVATPRTHRRFLSRDDGTYGPIPSRRPLGILSMPMNRTSVSGLYCVGDSTFPGQGVNAVVFSGVGCAHRVAVDIGMEPGWPKPVDSAFTSFLQFIRDRS